MTVSMKRHCRVEESKKSFALMAFCCSRHRKRSNGGGSLTFAGLFYAGKRPKAKPMPRITGWRLVMGEATIRFRVLSIWCDPNRAPGLQVDRRGHGPAQHDEGQESVRGRRAVQIGPGLGSLAAESQLLLRLLDRGVQEPSRTPSRAFHHHRCPAQVRSHSDRLSRARAAGLLRDAGRCAAGRPSDPTRDQQDAGPFLHRRAAGRDGHRPDRAIAERGQHDEEGIRGFQQECRPRIRVADDRHDAEAT